MTNREPRFTLLEGDCIKVMASLEPASVDAIVTDPPYGLEFMGKDWDKFADVKPARRSGWDYADSGAGLTHAPFKNLGTLPTFGNRWTYECCGCGRRDAFGPGGRNACRCSSGPEWRRVRTDEAALQAFQNWCETWAAEALRVLRPGGHLLAFGGTRTYHRLACAIEDAGFEIRDSLMWLYGQGFAKSWNFDTRYDGDWCGCKAPGGESEGVQQPSGALADGVSGGRGRCERCGGLRQDFHGFSTALKPAHEPIVVARKPLIGTVAENVLEYGTGAINVDACRIDSQGKADRESARPGGRATAKSGALGGGIQNDNERREFEAENSKGRWPANVILDEAAAVELDQQSGELRSGFLAAGTEREGHGYRGGLGNRVRHSTYGDSGGASRFYYCAKASKAERNAGLETFERRNASKWNNSGLGRRRSEAGASFMQNDHPCVKPINLGRHIVRLVTPPGGVVLDPFAGSGSLGCSTVLEGFDFIGIERESEYLQIAEARCCFWAPHVGRDVKEVLGKRRRAAEHG